MRQIPIKNHFMELKLIRNGKICTCRVLSSRWCFAIDFVLSSSSSLYPLWGLMPFKETFPRCFSHPENACSQVSASSGNAYTTLTRKNSIFYIWQRFLPNSDISIYGGSLYFISICGSSQSPTHIQYTMELLKTNFKRLHTSSCSQHVFPICRYNKDEFKAVQRSIDEEGKGSQVRYRCPGQVVVVFGCCCYWKKCHEYYCSTNNLSFIELWDNFGGTSLGWLWC